MDRKKLDKENADELSGALGYGSATDMSKKMGFSMTDLTQSPEKFRQIYNNIIVPFINTKRGSLTNQMGVYGSNIDAMSSAGGGTAANNDPLGIR